MRAALSHSRSKVTGQKASRWTRSALAAATLMLEGSREGLEELLAVLLRFPQAKKPPLAPLAPELGLVLGLGLELELELECLLSQDGRNAETRCMVGD